MTAQTDKARRAACDRRKRKQGLVRISVWVPKERAEDLRREADNLLYHWSQRQQNRRGDER